MEWKGLFCGKEEWGGETKEEKEEEEDKGRTTWRCGDIEIKLPRISCDTTVGKKKHPPNEEQESAGFCILGLLRILETYLQQSEFHSNGTSHSSGVQTWVLTQQGLNEHQLLKLLP